MRIATGTLVLAAAALAPAAALAVEAAERQAEESVAAVEWSRGWLELAPRVEYERLMVTVSGGGGIFERQFQAGEKTLFALVDEAGKPLPDGSYTYEIRVVPRVDEGTRKALAEARESDDRKMLERLRREGRLPEPPPVQSGHFVLAGGERLVPRELEPRRPAGPEPGKGSYRLEGDLEVDGDLAVRGTKSFAAPDPEDGGRLLYYSALEGPEAGTYYRGTARLIDGVAVVELPEHFAKLTEAEGLTVQLTPVGGWSRLWVAERSPRRLEVRAAPGGAATGVDFLVQGVRRGYADFAVERRAPAGRQMEKGDER